MIMKKHDESRRKAVIRGPHGNLTKRHTLTMATELAREYCGESVGAGAGLWLFELIHSHMPAAHHGQLIHGQRCKNRFFPHYEHMYWLDGWTF